MMRGFESLLPRQQYAEMAEWSIASVLKTEGGEPSVGSNPTLRAKEKNIINLLTFTNECVILISSSEPNKKTSLGSSTVESNKVCLRCGFNSHLRANKEVWTKLLHLIIGSEKIIINY